jgi:hypothetical protein
MTKGNSAIRQTVLAIRVIGLIVFAVVVRITPHVQKAFQFFRCEVRSGFIEVETGYATKDRQIREALIIGSSVSSTGSSAIATPPTFSRP